jgi:hypothetical protein
MQKYLIETTAQVKTKRNGFTLTVNQFLRDFEEVSAPDLCKEDISDACRKLMGYYQFDDIDECAYTVEILSQKVTKL